MIKSCLIVKNLRDQWLLIAVAFLLVGAMQYLILTLVIEADILVVAESFMSRMPPQIQQFMGEAFFTQFTVSGAVALGYNHPLVLVMLILVAIHLPASNIAAEIEEGTMELLLSQPLRRIDVFVSAWLLSAIVLLITVCGCLAGTFLGMFVYPDTRVIPLFSLLQMAANLWLLLLAVNAYTFFLSVKARESTRATLPAAVLTLFFYFTNYIFKMWPAMKKIEITSLFNYYQPQQLMTNSAHFGLNVLLLSVVILVFTALAAQKIRLRDIP